MPRRPVLIVCAAAVAGAAALGAVTTASASSSALAHPDSYSVRSGSTLTVRGRGVLANDPTQLTTVVAHTPTATAP